ncbi:hypothetical protein KUTeg_001101 [Tegillarca granosa]|uniref:DAGKc domain-containing protein n=1 Tax=Tegillarca granosa TaxID=220873 RepID=A0ABQ9FYL3_TEGGR|nr:hypothetical protein KUTeg_001101 [Tegillarca granosa]
MKDDKSFQDIKETWKISDVIGIEHQSVDAGKQKEIKIHVIEDTDQNNLIDKTATLEAEEHVLREIVRRIKEQISKVSCRPRSLLVLINPVGGSKAGEQIYSEVVAPIFRLAEIETEILVSKQSNIVICGGDGTVNECLASIYRRAQEDAGIDCNDPNAKVVPFPLPICQIPTGTGNGLAEMACRSRDVQTVALHSNTHSCYKAPYTQVRHII